MIPRGQSLGRGRPPRRFDPRSVCHSLVYIADLDASAVQERLVAAKSRHDFRLRLHVCAYISAVLDNRGCRKCLRRRRHPRLRASGRQYEQI